MGTYFKIVDTWYHEYSKLAEELITWIRSKTLFHAVLKSTHGAMTNTNGLAVLRAVLTRWTSHYLAYCRLDDLRLALQTVVQNDVILPDEKKCVIIGDSRAKEKARSMVVIINDPRFWVALGR